MKGYLSQGIVRWRHFLVPVYMVNAGVWPGSMILELCWVDGFGRGWWWPEWVEDGMNMDAPSSRSEISMQISHLRRMVTWIAGLYQLCPRRDGGSGNALTWVFQAWSDYPFRTRFQFLVPGSRVEEDKVRVLCGLRGMSAKQGERIEEFWERSLE